MPSPVESHDARVIGEKITLRVSDLTYGGAAVGRVGDLVVFVNGAAPGEFVEARITEQHKRFSRADVTRVIEPSPDRVAPPCPYFGGCGGCQWQFIDYRAQVAAKNGILRDQFRRGLSLSQQDLDALFLPPIGMTEPWAYRNVITVTPDSDGKPSFRHWQSAERVPIDHCLISQPAINGTLRGLADDGIEDDVTIRVSEVGIDATAVTAGAVTQRLLDRSFRVSSGAFFQVNTKPEIHGPAGMSDMSMADILAQNVLDGLALTGTETLLDVYSGVGTFAILAAPHARRVVAVEDVPAAATDARYNVRAAGLTNVSVHTRKAERFLTAFDERVDVVVLDPPRAGCASPVLDALIRLKPRRIVYVSCDPATLVRDLRALYRAYTAETVQMIDMFPQTYHIESVTVLSRREVK